MLPRRSSSFGAFAQLIGKRAKALVERHVARREHVQKNRGGDHQAHWSRGNTHNFAEVRFEQRAHEDPVILSQLSARRISVELLDIAQRKAVEQPLQ